MLKEAGAQAPTLVAALIVGQAVRDGVLTEEQAQAVEAEIIRSLASTTLANEFFAGINNPPPGDGMMGDPPEPGLRESIAGDG
jgi:hypothetical protein